MSAWGPGLYQDDIAEDVKYDFKEYFKQGLNNEEVYAKMLQRYESEIKDTQDGPVFWFALADTMWGLGKLTDEVKEKALQCIEEGKDVAYWREQSEKIAQKRQAVLDKLKEKLESPMPPEKRIGKKRIFTNKWKIGDMYVMPIVEEYPRFPEMTAKYLLLIKIDDAKDLSDHIQPVVYIKYLDEEYHEGIDINQLKFSHPYDNGTRFIISGIAGRPHPKALTYVGNYGDISTLEKPQNEEDKEKLNCNCIVYPKHLERDCVGVYLKYILGIEGQILGETMYMTKEEYQQYTKTKEAKKIEADEKRYAERKKKEFYICPWEDGDVFYLPLNKDVQEGEELINKGYVGVVLIKVGVTEDYATTNMWPVVIMQCVKKEYGNVNDILSDNVFCDENGYKKEVLTHKKNIKIPDKLKLIGNINNLKLFNIIDEIRIPSRWNRIEWYILNILKVK